MEVEIQMQEQLHLRFLDQGGSPRPFTNASRPPSGCGRVVVGVADGEIQRRDCKKIGWGVLEVSTTSFARMKSGEDVECQSDDLEWQLGAN